jgi:hypothetical protein
MNVMAPITAAATRIAVVSSRSHLATACRGGIAQSTMTGAIRMVPAASASHQLTEGTTKLERLRSLVESCPNIALAELVIAVGTKAISTNRPMPSGVKKVFAPYDR